MSKNTIKNSAKTPVQIFAYRNIKKEFTIFEATAEITKQKHLELTEFNGTKIVDDRNIDWAELANRDIDQVGLANILALACKNKQNLAQFAMRNAAEYALKDSDCADISMVDPMNPDAMEALAKQGQTSKAKLDGLAKQLGISTDDLIESVVNGTLETLIQKKLEAVKESEVKDNA